MKDNVLIKSSILLLIFIYSFSGQKIYSQDPCRLLVWSDEFNYSGLPDSTKWAYDIGDGCDYGICNWGNAEAQSYTYKDLDNARVENGSLFIEARKELTVNKKYSSARLVTRDLLEITYGRIEFRAKLQTGKGTWSAFWLLGDREKLGWPACGEIDVMEYVGVEPGIVRGTVHQSSGYGGEGPSMALSVPDAETEFHVYSIEWNSDSIVWFVDDIKYHVYYNENTGDAQWPYDKTFYLLMNLTIGGTLGGPIDNSIFDNMVAMEVDYVRIYQKISESNIFGKSTISENEGQLEYSSFVPASKYTWTVPSTAQIVSGAGTSSILVDWGCEEGNVELELETICDTAVISLPVTFEEIQLMGKSLVYQKEKSLKYSAPTISGATYAWTVPEGVNFIGDNDTNEIELEWGCNPGQISLEITGTCLSKTITKDVAIVPLLITGPEYLSSWSSNIDYLLDNNQVGSIKWGVPDDVIINSGETSYLLNVDWGTAAGYVTVELTNSCGVLKDSILVNITDNLILADFDVIDPEFLVFGGAHMEKAENPSKSELNSSDLTGMAYKDATATTWGGIYFDLDQTLDFIYGSTFSLSVFAPVTGNVLFKIENNSGPEEVEISKPITKVNEWEKLSWTFNNVASDTYNRIALFFDFGQTRQDSFYFDDVVLNRNLTPGISLSQKEDIMERDEDGKIIEVILSGDRFVEVLNMDNWIFENLPEGVSVGSANRISDTRVDLVLSGNATEDYDLDITNFSVLILAAELVGSNTNLSISTGVVFTALIEDFIQENNTLDKFITVYPNPVNKLLNIKVNNEFTGELSGKIINSEGKVLNEFRITNEKLIQIDMKEFPKGSYIVSLKGPKGNWNRIIFYQ